MTTPRVEQALRRTPRDHPNLKAIDDLMDIPGRSANAHKLSLRRYLQEALEILEQEGVLTCGDAWHSMDELYDYRMAYHAHAVKLWQDNSFKVVKSWQHHDGEDLRTKDLFIVSVQLPTGQVSNHYKAKYWDMFDCPVVERAPAWDGHTPGVALNRLISALPQTAMLLAPSGAAQRQRATLNQPTWPAPVPSAITEENLSDLEQNGLVSYRPGGHEWGDSVADLDDPGEDMIHAMEG